ncbi:MAG: CBS domain-containing protein [Sulfurimonas sp.]|nr:CBS domain-containing protein [Sulfurimonas sp.]
MEESNNNFSAITINQDMIIAKTMDTIITNNIKSIIYVVDNQNKIQGFISVGNIAKHIYYGNISPSTSLFPASSILHYLTAEFVKDIMNKNFIYYNGSLFQDQ